MLFAYRIVVESDPTVYVASTMYEAIALAEAEMVSRYRDEEIASYFRENLEACENLGVVSETQAALFVRLRTPTQQEGE